MKEVNGRSPFSVEHIIQKDVSEVRCSLSVAGTDDSLTMDSVDPVSISDRRSLLQNNISFSPNFHKKSLGTLLEEVKLESPVSLKLKPKDVEARAALSSFEAMLGNLTRTKDSIGRATRVAIECAKFGFGPKVIQFLF